jgi:phage-related protein
MADSPTMEVRARLTADSAQFTKGLQEASKSAENFQGAAGKLNSSLTALGGIAAGTAIALIAFATKSFRAAAEVQELDIALQAIGQSTRYGYTQLAIAVEEIKNVGISAVGAQRAVIKLAQSNVDLGNATQLATVAQNLSVTSSVSSADALQTLIFAVTTGQTRMLRQIGITTGATEAFAIYGRTIGKSATELNMAERRQAVMNFILKEGTKVQGAYALAIQSPSRALKEMGDQTRKLQEAVGSRLLNAFSKIILSALALSTKFTKASEGSGTFSKFLDAMEKVLTKLADPFVKLLDGIGNFIEKIDKSKVSVDEIAGTMEKVLPVAAAFATFFGIKAGKSLAQAAPFFQGFFQTLARFNAVFTLLVLAVTSPQIRSALGQLVTAFAPLVPILKKVSAVFTEVSALAIGVVAKAIRLVASIVSTSIAIIQKYAGVFKALGVAIAAVAIGYGAYRTAILLTTAATVIWGTVTAGTTMVINALRTAVAILNMTIALNPIPLFIGVIVALLVALGYLIKTNKSVGDAFKTVFNFIAKVVISVFAYIVKAIGYVIKAFASIMRVIGFFAEVVAMVFEFVIDIILTWYKFLLKAIKFVVDAFIMFMEAQGTLYDVVKTIFNAIIKVISLVVEGIVRVFAFVIGAVADLVGVFNKLYGGVKSIFLAILNAISKVGEGIFGILDDIAQGVGKFLGFVFDKLTGWIKSLAALFEKIPLVGAQISSGIKSGLAAGQALVTGFASTLVGFGKTAFDGILSGVTKTVNGISTVGDSVEKGLRATEKTLTKFAVKVEEFGNKDNGAKLIEGLVGGAKTASLALGTMIDVLGEAVKFDFAGTVGKFIDSVADKADAAGDYLINLSTQMLAFAETTDFAAAAGDGISNFIETIKDSLKEGLGFGDILKKEKEKAAGLPGGGTEDALSDIQDKADLMKKIREAMTAGIESMRDVLQDLQQAAKDFADSLKDTIMGFAGLKGVELPDGFIPKAKSLIENMRTRLDKSQQFANQITQLQALGLDATAIKDIVESGPIKGAQLAASILGGGADAISQINEIQKSIAFTGAAIGKFGSEAAFGQKIASAQAGIAQITDAEASIRGAGGNNVVIEQGAFVVNVDTSGATDQNEKADLITKRIQETFAILAKELANK